MATPFLNSLERAFLARHVSGVTPQMPIDQLRRRYYVEYVGGDNIKRGLDDVEQEWMLKYISDNGGTVSGTYYSELWKQMVSVIGKTPTPRISENKVIFYTNAS